VYTRSVVHSMFRSPAVSRRIISQSSRTIERPDAATLVRMNFKTIQAICSDKISARTRVANSFRRRHRATFRFREKHVAITRHRWRSPISGNECRRWADAREKERERERERQRERPSYRRAIRALSIPGANWAAYGGALRTTLCTGTLSRRCATRMLHRCALHRLSSSPQSH